MQQIKLQSFLSYQLTVHIFDGELPDTHLCAISSCWGVGEYLFYTLLPIEWASSL